jgi:hypothetical protein
LNVADPVLSSPEEFRQRFWKSQLAKHPDSAYLPIGPDAIGIENNRNLSDNV